MQNNASRVIVLIPAYKPDDRLTELVKELRDKNLVPMGNKEGVLCAVGRSGARAYYGPGEHYAPVEEKLPAWTEVIVYHEENGWVMADFVLPGAKDDQYDEEQKQLTRAWIPVWALDGYESAEVFEEYEDCGEGEWEAVG